MRKLLCLLAALALVAGIWAQAGASSILEHEQERTTLLGSIANDWQIYTVLIMMVMLGLVALAYAIANAFSLPDLRAWADVELGEIFASALLLIFIIGIVLFIDMAVRGTIAPSFPGSCERGGFCAANIAYDYLESYKKAAFGLYESILKSNMEKAREATQGHTVGVQDMIYLYITYRFRTGGPEMITVEMYDQLLQNLGAIIGTLMAQGFVLKFLSLRLAPIAIFLGIILRTFFMTRKLGGLLLAFGLGFLVVYPLTYALAWYTLDAAIYGAQKGPTGQLSACPEVCLPSSRIADYISSGSPVLVEKEDVLAALYDDCIEDIGDVDETGRSRTCMDGCVAGYRAACEEGCARGCRLDGLAPPVEDCGAYCEGTGVRGPVGDCFAYCGFTGESFLFMDEGWRPCADVCDATYARDSPEWDECMLDCSHTYMGPFPYTASCIYNCEENQMEPSAEWTACLGRCSDANAAARPLWEECIGGCEGRNNCDATADERESYCRRECPVLPEYAEGRDEYCRREAEDRLVGLGMGGINIESGGFSIHNFKYCEYTKCGFPVPYHVADCIKYAGRPDVCNTRPFDPEDPAYAEFDASELVDGCPAECRTLAPMKEVGESSCRNVYCKELRDGRELWEMCVEKWGYLTCIQSSAWESFYDQYACKEYSLKCPSQCMWVTTGNYSDPTCPETCKDLYPDNPQYLWENDLYQQTCVYIIPDVVFEDPEKCGNCAFVAEKGLTMKPPMILDCGRFCGSPSLKVMAEDPATMTNRIGGMVGPTELVSVSKLMIPAYVLPLFNLAVTLMFIITLSPMLGGDFDLPGMMRMIQ
ncbi:MAG TPA: hypothetical protein PKJ97_00220 [Candidatus Bilamarchaeaceae archaeon]|nr:hypothetical protein [Candidatus Bilamarchaeaceae archaeon]